MCKRGIGDLKVCGRIIGLLELVEQARDYVLD